MPGATRAFLAAWLWTGAGFDGKLDALVVTRNGFDPELILLCLIEHGDDHDRRSQ